MMKKVVLILTGVLLAIALVIIGGAAKAWLMPPETVIPEFAETTPENSVEAGKDFLTALREINGRRQKDALTEELTRTLHEIQLGKSRQAALRDLGNRVRQGDLTSVVNAIVQADELGVSIGQLLRIQGEQLRSKRFSRAEKLANETPVKILFPVVVFIFPSVFLILMGPIIMQAMNTVFGG